MELSFLPPPSFLSAQATSKLAPTPVARPEEHAARPLEPPNGNKEQALTLHATGEPTSLGSLGTVRTSC